MIRRGYIVLQEERGNSAVTDTRRVASCSKAVCATVLAIASEQSQQGHHAAQDELRRPGVRVHPLGAAAERSAQGQDHRQATAQSHLWHLSRGDRRRQRRDLGIHPRPQRRPRTAKLAFDPGTACGYSTHALAHAALVCENVTGKPYDEFAIEALFKPLGIEHWWFQYYDGGPKMGRHPSHGLGMPARDLARIAYCMLRDGRWNDRQVIPKWFVDADRRADPRRARARKCGSRSTPRSSLTAGSCPRA